MVLVCCDGLEGVDGVCLKWEKRSKGLISSVTAIIHGQMRGTPRQLPKEVSHNGLLDQGMRDQLIAAAGGLDSKSTFRLSSSSAIPSRAELQL